MNKKVKVYNMKMKYYKNVWLNKKIHFNLKQKINNLKIKYNNYKQHIKEKKNIG